MKKSHLRPIKKAISPVLYFNIFFFFVLQPYSNKYWIFESTSRDFFLRIYFIQDASFTGSIVNTRIGRHILFCTGLNSISLCSSFSFNHIYVNNERKKYLFILLSISWKYLHITNNNTLCTTQGTLPVCDSTCLSHRSVLTDSERLNDFPKDGQNYRPSKQILSIYCDYHNLSSCKTPELKDCIQTLFLLCTTSHCFNRIDPKVLVVVYSIPVLQQTFSVTVQSTKI